MELLEQLEANNRKYWEVRNRVKESQKNNNSRYMHKRDCRYKTNRLIESGVLQKSPCEVCGEIEAQVHHLNYDDPSDVLFLCHTHHVEWHRKNGSVA